MWLLYRNVVHWLPLLGKSNLQKKCNGPKDEGSSRVGSVQGVPQDGGDPG